MRTTKYGTKTPSDLSPKLCNLIPDKYKTIASLAGLKTKIKTWVTEKCPCRFFKTFIHPKMF